MKCKYCREKMTLAWADEYGNLWECYICNHEEWIETWH